MFYVSHSRRAPSRYTAVCISLTRLSDAQAAVNNADGSQYIYAFRLKVKAGFEPWVH